MIILGLDTTVHVLLVVLSKTGPRFRRTWQGEVYISLNKRSATLGVSKASREISSILVLVLP
jgi:hypothetical protein